MDQGQATGGFPLAIAAAEVNAIAAGYAPPDMWRVANDMRELPDVFANTALAVRTYTQRLEGQYPIASQVVEQIGELYVQLAQLATAAQQIEPLFRALHEHDLQRGEQPRVGEPTWNV